MLNQWTIGCGIADITAEPWGVGMMGYGIPGQWSQGILTRQYARAFVFDDGTRNLVWVVADIGMFFQAAVDAITDKLSRNTGGRLNAHNTVLTATHTHCGPGGHSHHLLYNITTWGFHRRTFDRIVVGVVEAITQADDDRQPAGLQFAQDHLTTASVNRSPSAFDRNPEHDRRAHPQRVDPLTTLVRITTADGLRGVINWFAVHNTSMTNGTTLISSDNKGWASRAWEAETGIIAGFGQTNAGDISPNLDGQAGHGPTADERENTKLIGERQLDAAKKMAAAADDDVEAILDYRLRYVDLHRQDTEGGPTSPAVLGASFAAGTSDGLGSPLFRQGKNNPLLDRVSRALYYWLPGLARSQEPKDLLLPVGPMGWVQQRLPVQLVRIGGLYLLCLPVEVTITAGLRLRRAVAEALGCDVAHVLVQGYTNGYAHYLTTEYEYDEQRYEAGSTIFGKHELAAFIEAARSLAEAIATGTAVNAGPPPPRRMRPLIPALTGASRAGRRTQTIPLSWPESAQAGQTVAAEFTSQHPNTPVRDEYFRIERYDGSRWSRAGGDASLNTQIRWRRRRGRFIAHIVWTIPDDAAGEYRIGLHADHYTALTPRFPVAALADG